MRNRGPMRRGGRNASCVMDIGGVNQRLYNGSTKNATGPLARAERAENGWPECGRNAAKKARTTIVSSQPAASRLPPRHAPPRGAGGGRGRGIYIGIFWGSATSSQECGSQALQNTKASSVCLSVFLSVTTLCSSPTQKRADGRLGPRIAAALPAQRPPEASTGRAPGAASAREAARRVGLAHNRQLVEVGDDVAEHRVRPLLRVHLVVAPDDAVDDLARQGGACPPGRWR